MAVRLLARTLRGLEDLAATEIAERGLGRVEHTRHREVWFTADRPHPGLLDLRTIDDLFLLTAVLDGVGHTKAELARFADAAAASDLDESLRQRHRCGAAAEPSGVDVAASFLGKRNYNRYDIEDAVGAVAAAGLGLPYHSRRDGAAPPAGTISFRVTVENDQAVLAVRVAERPLHRRSYKQASTPGTLHPPLAAAMVLLAGLGQGGTVLDPCCGTGTILIEAAGLVPEVRLIGADHDGAALSAAVANAELTDTTASWLRADAGRLPVGSRQVDRIVSNPPWDRQVSAAASLAAHPDRFYSELRRVLVPEGRAVLLHTEDEHAVGAAKAAGLTVESSRRLSLFGAHPSLVTLTG